MQVLKAFRGSIIASIVVLALVGWFSRSPALVLTALVLSILEVSLSFDNAVVNAKYLKKMSPLWQKLFLTVGILIAVFGMRLVFPIVIVAVTAGLGFARGHRPGPQRRPALRRGAGGGASPPSTPSAARSS